MSRFIIYESDWNGNDITDNAGAGTIEEAIGSGIRMCERASKPTAEVAIFKCGEDDGEERYVASVYAPSGKKAGIVNDRELCERLRTALFGQDEADADPDESDDYIDDALDALFEEFRTFTSTIDEARGLVISEHPVVVYYGCPKVYTSSAVKDALFDVFYDEVERYRAEQEVEE